MARRFPTERFHRLLEAFIQPAVHGASTPVRVAAHHVRGEPIPYAEAYAADYEPFAVGEAWGGRWDTTWFHIQGEVPPAWQREEVVFRIDLGLGNWPGFGGEALIWEDGEPQQGVSAFHSFYPVSTAKPVDLYVEAAANPPPGKLMAVGEWPVNGPDPHGPPLFVLKAADLAVLRRPVWDYLHDFRVLVNLLDDLADDDRRAAELYNALSASVARLDPSDVPGTVAAARPPLQDALAKPSRSAHLVSAVGHAHIDTAWLWPLRETPRKAARTFSNALRLMEEYPDYKFLASQPQQYAWVRDQYPGVFERIRTRVKDGRFEPVGAMWVEADCNIPSGESLCRQLVHGKRFFLDEFGVETREVWLPDVFGYAAQLPQLMRQAGVEWFLTQKLSWNDTNRFPHSTFEWEALDGSKVLAHFPPTDTYVGQFDAAELRTGERNFKQHDVSDRSLYLFGWGDGGGGPTREMLESAKRMKDLDGLPPVALEQASEFFVKMDAERGPLPVWVGELYFEFHRGTYTTQAGAKRGNRKSEVLLHDAEFLSVVAGGEYRAEDLDWAWKQVLLNQFHDIIPGSGIQWVYDDAAASYALVAETARAITDQALAAIAADVDTTATARPVLLVNTTSHDRDEVVVVEGRDEQEHAVGPDGVAVAGQRLADGGLAFRASVPAMGWALYDVRPGWAGSNGSAAVFAGDGCLENDVLRVSWDDDGLLTSVVDKRTRRQVLADGCRGNVLQLFHDYPPQYDAWDIDPSYGDRMEELTALDAVEVVDQGPVRAAVRFRRSFGSSTVVQTMWLDAGSAVLGFDTEVDWRERHRLLKVAFPLDIRTQRASYEVQFGVVERPTHRNTSWDAAKYEVCAQRWGDMSDAGYGVALLNDCKYGYDAAGGVLRLTLLRGATAPDPHADLGRHRFAYALYPHAGQVPEGGVVAAGISFNYPLLVAPAAPGHAGGSRTGSWFRVDGPGVVLDTVKKADDGNGVVVRLYEAVGGRAEARLSTSLPLAGASLADLLERPCEELAVQDGSVSLTLPPFRLATVVLAAP